MRRLTGVVTLGDTARKRSIILVSEIAVSDLGSTGIRSAMIPSTLDICIWENTSNSAPERLTSKFHFSAAPILILPSLVLAVTSMLIEIWIGSRDRRTDGPLQVMREFCDDPVGFVEAAMEGIIIPLRRRSSAFHR